MSGAIKAVLASAYCLALEATKDHFWVLKFPQNSPYRTGYGDRVGVVLMMLGPYQSYRMTRMFA